MMGFDLEFAHKLLISVALMTAVYGSMELTLYTAMERRMRRSTFWAFMAAMYAVLVPIVLAL